MYGASKAAGEQAVEELLGLGVDGHGAILRTSWVYGAVGKNFLLTMLRLHRVKASQGESLAVVAEVVGVPLVQGVWLDAEFCLLHVVVEVSILVHLWSIRLPVLLLLLYRCCCDCVGGR